MWDLGPLRSSEQVYESDCGSILIVGGEAGSRHSGCEMVMSKFITMLYVADEMGFLIHSSFLE